MSNFAVSQLEQLLFQELNNLLLQNPPLELHKELYQIALNHANQFLDRKVQTLKDGSKERKKNFPRSIRYAEICFVTLRPLETDNAHLVETSKKLCSTINRRYLNAFKPGMNSIGPVLIQMKSKKIVTVILLAFFQPAIPAALFKNTFEQLSQEKVGVSNIQYFKSLLDQFRQLAKFDLINQIESKDKSSLTQLAKYHVACKVSFSIQLFQKLVTEHHLFKILTDYWSYLTITSVEQNASKFQLIMTFWREDSFIDYIVDVTVVPEQELKGQIGLDETAKEQNKQPTNSVQFVEPPMQLTDSFANSEISSGMFNTAESVIRAEVEREANGGRSEVQHHAEPIIVQERTVSLSPDQIKLNDLAEQADSHKENEVENEKSAEKEAENAGETVKTLNEIQNATEDREAEACLQVQAVKKIAEARDHEAKREAAARREAELSREIEQKLEGESNLERSANLENQLAQELQQQKEQLEASNDKAILELDDSLPNQTITVHPVVQSESELQKNLEEEAMLLAQAKKMKEQENDLIDIQQEAIDDLKKVQHKKEEAKERVDNNQSIVQHELEIASQADSSRENAEAAILEAEEEKQSALQTQQEILAESEEQARNAVKADSDITLEKQQEEEAKIKKDIAEDKLLAIQGESAVNQAAANDTHEMLEDQLHQAEENVENAIVQLHDAESKKRELVEAQNEADALKESAKIKSAEAEQKEKELQQLHQIEQREKELKEDAEEIYAQSKQEAAVLIAEAKSKEDEAKRALQARDSTEARKFEADLEEQAEQENLEQTQNEIQEVEKEAAQNADIVAIEQEREKKTQEEIDALRQSIQTLGNAKEKELEKVKQALEIEQMASLQEEQAAERKTSALKEEKESEKLAVKAENAAIRAELQKQDAQRKKDAADEIEKKALTKAGEYNNEARQQIQHSQQAENASQALQEQINHDVNEQIKTIQSINNLENQDQIADDFMQNGSPEQIVYGLAAKQAIESTIDQLATNAEQNDRNIVNEVGMIQQVEQDKKDSIETQHELIEQSEHQMKIAELAEGARQKEEQREELAQQQANEGWRVAAELRENAEKMKVVAEQAQQDEEESRSLKMVAAHTAEQAEQAISNIEEEISEQTELLKEKENELLKETEDEIEAQKREEKALQKEDQLKQQEKAQIESIQRAEVLSDIATLQLEEEAREFNQAQNEQIELTEKAKQKAIIANAAEKTIEHHQQFENEIKEQSMKTSQQIDDLKHEANEERSIANAIERSINLDLPNQEEIEQLDENAQEAIEEAVEIKKQEKMESQHAKNIAIELGKAEVNLQTQIHDAEQEERKHRENIDRKQNEAEASSTLFNTLAEEAQQIEQDVQNSEEAKQKAIDASKEFQQQANDARKAAVDSEYIASQQQNIVKEAEKEEKEKARDVDNITANLNELRQERHELEKKAAEIHQKMGLPPNEQNTDQHQLIANLDKEESTRKQQEETQNTVISLLEEAKDKQAEIRELERKKLEAHQIQVDEMKKAEEALGEAETLDAQAALEGIVANLDEKQISPSQEENGEVNNIVEKIEEEDEDKSDAPIEVPIVEEQIPFDAEKNFEKTISKDKWQKVTHDAENNQPYDDSKDVENLPLSLKSSHKTIISSPREHKERHIPTEIEDEFVDESGLKEREMQLEQELENQEQSIQEKEEPQQEEKVEHKPEPQQEKKVEHKPEPQQEKKVEHKPEPQQEEKVEHMQEPQQEKKAEHKPEPQQEKKVEQKVEHKPEPQQEKKVEHKPEQKVSQTPVQNNTSQSKKQKQKGKNKQPEPVSQKVQQPVVQEHKDTPTEEKSIEQSNAIQQPKPDPKAIWGSYTNQLISSHPELAVEKKEEKKENEPKKDRKEKQNKKQKQQAQQPAAQPKTKTPTRPQFPQPSFKSVPWSALQLNSQGEFEVINQPSSSPIETPVQQQSVQEQQQAAPVIVEQQIIIAQTVEQEIVPPVKEEETIIRPPRNAHQVWSVASRDLQNIHEVIEVHQMKIMPQKETKQKQFEEQTTPKMGDNSQRNKKSNQDQNKQSRREKKENEQETATAQNDNPWTRIAQIVDSAPESFKGKQNSPQRHKPKPTIQRNNQPQQEKKEEIRQPKHTIWDITDSTPYDDSQDFYKLPSYLKSSHHHEEIKKDSPRNQQHQREAKQNKTETPVKQNEVVKQMPRQPEEHHQPYAIRPISPKLNDAWKNLNLSKSSRQEKSFNQVQEPQTFESVIRSTSNDGNLHQSTAFDHNEQIIMTTYNHVQQPVQYQYEYQQQQFVAQTQQYPDLRPSQEKLSAWSVVASSTTYDDSRTFRNVPIEFRSSHSRPLPQQEKPSNKEKRRQTNKRAPVVEKPRQVQDNVNHSQQKDSIWTLKDSTPFDDSKTYRTTPLELRNTHNKLVSTRPMETPSKPENKVEDKQPRNQQKVDQQQNKVPLIPIVQIEQPVQTIKKNSPYTQVLSGLTPYDDSRDYLHTVPPEFRNSHNKQVFQQQTVDEQPQISPRPAARRQQRDEPTKMKPLPRSDENKQDKAAVSVDVPKVEAKENVQEKPEPAYEEKLVQISPRAKMVWGNAMSSISTPYDDKNDVRRLPPELRKTHSNKAVEEKQSPRQEKEQEKRQQQREPKRQQQANERKQQQNQLSQEQRTVNEVKQENVIKEVQKQEKVEQKEEPVVSIPSPRLASVWGSVNLTPFDDSKSLRNVPAEFRRSHNQPSVSKEKQQPKETPIRKQQQKQPIKQTEQVSPRLQKEVIVVPAEKVVTVPVEEIPPTVQQTHKTTAWDSLNISDSYDDSKRLRNVPTELKRSHNKPSIGNEQQQQPKQPQIEQPEQVTPQIQKEVIVAPVEEEVVTVPVEEEVVTAPVEEIPPTVQQTPKTTVWNSLNISDSYDDSKSLRNVPAEFKRSHNKPSAKNEKQQQPKQKPHRKQQPRPMQTIEQTEQVKPQIQEEVVTVPVEEEVVTVPVQEVPRSPKQTAWGSISTLNSYDDSKDYRRVAANFKRTHDLPKSPTPKEDQKSKKNFDQNRNKNKRNNERSRPPKALSPRNLTYNTLQPRVPQQQPQQIEPVEQVQSEQKEQVIPEQTFVDNSHIVTEENNQVEINNDEAIAPFVNKKPSGAWTQLTQSMKH